MNTYENILVYADTTRSLSHRGVEWAAHLAASGKCAITIMDVAQDPPWYLTADIREANLAEDRAQRERVLKDFAEALEEKGIQTTVVVGTGEPYVTIIQKVLQDGHDLVVKSMMRGDSGGRLFGSVAQRLLRKCPCPVLLVKSDTPPPVTRIVAAVDPDPDNSFQASLNHNVIDAAICFPRNGEKPVTVVHAWSMYGEAMLSSRLSPEQLQARHNMAEENVRAALARLVGQTAEGAPAVVEVVRGEPEESIPAYVKREEADLLVIGTMARSGVAGFIVGNTAENILEHIQCSVLAVKPDGFVSPIS